ERPIYSLQEFCASQNEENLIQCITTRARRICTEDTIENELLVVRSIFLQNGYPERFVDSAMVQRDAKVTKENVEKKVIYMSLPFKGDTLAEAIDRRLSDAVHRTYFASKLRILFSSKPAVYLRLKDNMPVSAASFCVYSFTCSCGTTYIGRTSRRLSERIREHHPAWLNTGITKLIGSAVLAHLVDSGHKVNVNEAFKPLYKVPGQQPRTIKCFTLTTAEAVRIRIHNPLCVPKNNLCKHSGSHGSSFTQPATQVDL
ncbi:hypothetical protein, partial [Streptococcus dysgalactiae]|uniref:hypothetical protein n=1 Tax=Streptococcus dysgalactiae TaxID=1334 RepID=UPI0019506BA1